jgi:outer membrane protein OmpA-like peptidoglycan-associated protein
MIKTPYFSMALILACSLSMSLSAQDDDKPEKTNNLVPNPSFEEFEDGLRRKEQFDLTTNWINPTESKSELYSAGVKSRYIAVPENMYGMEEPVEGNNFAGLVTYSYRSKVPRSYLQTELTEALKEKGLYCVKFKASLAERSRYASNNLGVSLDKSRLSNKSLESISAENPLFSEYNDVVDTRDGWWEFCTLYRATGKEKYLTIGNFNADDRTKTVLMDLPSKYTEEGPIIASYYFIDDVKVELIAVGESCNCASDRIPESKVIFSGSAQINDDMELKDKLETIDAYFYQYQAEVVSAAERTIDKVVDILNSNPSAKVTITGHSDNEEASLAEQEATLRGLAMKRANLVKTYMINSGIDELRINVKTMDNKAPVSNMTTPVSLAKNRRVEFELN